MSVAPASAPYGKDLAYIHDAGFGSLAISAAQELLARLSHAGIVGGTIVEFGCGSGILAERVAAAGFDVVGFDISAAMVAIAQARAPRCEFRHESFRTARLPEAVAVVAIGEVFNYLFDRKNSNAQFPRVLRRVQKALVPGGIFLFDVAGPGRAGPDNRRQGFAQTDDWACLYKAEEDRNRNILTRTITTFRRQGANYRRDHEVHQLRLMAPQQVPVILRAAGFRVRRLRDFCFPPGWAGFLATKKA